MTVNWTRGINAPFKDTACAFLGRIWNTCSVRRPTVGDKLDCGWTWRVKSPQHAHAHFVTLMWTFHPCSVTKITLDNPKVPNMLPILTYIYIHTKKQHIGQLVLPGVRSERLSSFDSLTIFSDNDTVRLVWAHYKDKLLLGCRVFQVSSSTTAHPNPAAALTAGQHKGNPWYSNLLETFWQFVCIYVCACMHKCVSKVDRKRHMDLIRKSPFVPSSAPLTGVSVTERA